MPMRRLLATKTQAEIVALKGSRDLQVSMTKADFEESLKRTRPSVNQGDLPRYREWAEAFGST